MRLDAINKDDLPASEGINYQMTKSVIGTFADAYKWRECVHFTSIIQFANSSFHAVFKYELQCYVRSQIYTQDTEYSGNQEPCGEPQKREGGVVVIIVNTERITYDERLAKNVSH